MAERTAAAVCVLLLGAAIVLASGGSASGNGAPAQLTTLPPEAAPAQVPEAGLVNINAATEEELDSLPGIGPKLAERIIDYRTEYGPFVSPADIIDVSGIGLSTYEKLKDHITV